MQRKEFLEMWFILAKLTHCKAMTVSADGEGGREKGLSGTLRGCCSIRFCCYLLLWLGYGIALFLASSALTWLVFCPAVAIQKTGIAILMQ